METGLQLMIVRQEAGAVTRGENSQLLRAKLSQAVASTNMTET